MAVCSTKFQYLKLITYTISFPTIGTIRTTYILDIWIHMKIDENFPLRSSLENYSKSYSFFQINIHHCLAIAMPHSTTSKHSYMALQSRVVVRKSKQSGLRSFPSTKSQALTYFHWFLAVSSTIYRMESIELAQVSSSDKCYAIGYHWHKLDTYRKIDMERVLFQSSYHCS